MPDLPAPPTSSGPAMEGFQAAMETAGYSDIGSQGNHLNPNLGLRKPPALMGLRQAGVRY